MEEHTPFDRKIGLRSVLHALAVGNISASADNRYFSPPDNLRDGKDGLVHVGLGVPIPRDQKHVSGDVDARFMDAEGRSGEVKITLHVDVANVGGRFVDRYICVESDHLTTGPQWTEVVAFGEGFGLYFCEYRGGEIKRHETYHLALGPFLHQRHGTRLDGGRCREAGRRSLWKEYSGLGSQRDRERADFYTSILVPWR